MTKENTVFKEIIQPFIVLVGICIVVAAILGFLNSVTAPVIAENARIAAEQTRKEVLPEAAGFKKIECDSEALGIIDAYADEGGNGYVISASRKGYKGAVVVTVGLDNDGTIVGIKADVSTETTGIGSRAGDPEYIVDRFKGLSGDADSVDTLSGATYSSKAVKGSVSAILDAFESVKEAAK